MHSTANLPPLPILKNFKVFPKTQLLYIFGKSYFLVKFSNSESSGHLQLARTRKKRTR